MILNFSEAFNIAIHALTFLASRGLAQPASTSLVAISLGVSEAHLSKVFQRLTKAGFVTPVRGPRGGFKLARPPASVKLLEIYETIDGAVLKDGHCLLEGNECTRWSCVYGNLLKHVSAQVDDYFSRTTLADLAEELPHQDS